MRRIVLSCVGFAVLLLPAAASARARPPAAKPGYVVVRKALNDGGPNGRPAITLVVTGFVLGRITQEAKVDIYHLPSSNSQILPSAKGQDVFPPISKHWNGLPGVEYRGSGFRFSAVGGSYRVVIRGAGIYLFAGGVRGSVKLRGSSTYRRTDGNYSVDAGVPRSLPTRQLTRSFGGQ
jgi:hypothetical protein